VTLVRTFPNLDAQIASLVDGLEIVATRRLRNRDDAHDVVQETISRLLDRVRVGAIATEAELAPVAWGIAHHVIADMLRERARLDEAPADVACSAPGPLDQLVTADEVTAVRTALRRLSADDQALLHRCFVHGERIGEIAAELGEPAERLRKRKSRALQRLAALLPGCHSGNENGDGAGDGRAGGGGGSHETAPITMES